MEQPDGTNAFGYSWSGDIVAVVLVLALLTPLFAFRRGWHVPGVLAGTAVGYMAYTGLSDTPWFWWKDYPFPAHMVTIGVVLAAAWFAAYRGTTRARSAVNHKPSRILQIIASLAALVTTLLLSDRLDSWEDGPKIVYVFLLCAIGMTVLAFLRSEGTTVMLAALALEAAAFYLALAIALPDHRDRSLNVAIATAVLAGAAIWRARHVSLVDDQKRPTAATSNSA